MAEFDVEMIEGPDTYIEHTKAVIKAITDGVTSMKEVTPGSVKAHVSAYTKRDQFTVRITATGECSADIPVEDIQQEFAFRCYQARHSFDAIW